MFLTALPLLVLNIDTARDANLAQYLPPRCGAAPAMMMVERLHEFARGPAG